MGANTTGITGNHDAETISDDMFAARLDHIDANVHELMQASERIEKHLEALAADVAAARPLLEKWQHSRIRKLAGSIGSGNAPWQQG